MGTQAEVKVQRFVFGDFSERNYSVQCKVRVIGKRGMSSEDVSEVNALLKDMGKWEAFVRLLHDLNIHPQESSSGNFGLNQYEVNSHLDELRGVLGVSFTLTEEEAMHRTGKTFAEIKTDEIANQVRNLEKWHNFAAFIKFAEEAWRTGSSH